MPFSMRFSYLLAASGLVCSSVLAQPTQKFDWPQWQGPHRDAISREPGLLRKWPEGGPPLAWRIDQLGGGDSAPSVADGRIFGMSNRGSDEVVWALSEKDGSELWSVRIAPAYEQQMPQSKEGPGCTPTVDQDRLYVMGMAGNVACLKVEDGSIVWTRDLRADFGGAVPPWSFRESPLVDGAYGAGGGALKLKKDSEGKFAAEEVYFAKEMQNHHGGLVVHEGALYGANGGNGGGFLSCLDFKTGETLWQDREAQKGSLTMADERLYLRTEDGEVVLIEPNQEQYVELARFTQPDRSDKPAWAHPVVANGMLYIRDHDLLFCYEVKSK